MSDMEKRYEEANALYESEQYDKAISLWQSLAEEGYAKAQNVLGFCFYSGEGVAQDPAKAVEWYTKAAEQGLAGAQFNLGLCYNKGEGVDQDYAKAIEWFSKAAEQGNIDAQFNLGCLFYLGEGVEQNETKAIEWFSKAAGQGDENAQEFLDKLGFETGKEIVKILDILKEDDSAMILPPAKEEAILQCGADLEEMALEPLPQGYIQFLYKCDGMSWNGIEFYGTHQVMEVETGYKVMDLVTMNDDFNNEWEFDEKVLLGKDDECFFTYNIETGKYEVTESGVQEALKEFDTFEALFSEEAGGRLEAQKNTVKKEPASNSLTWKDFDKIALALRKKHHDISPVPLKREDIRKMALELESFKDVETPDDFYLRAIQSKWIRLMHEGEDPSDPREVCP